MLSIPDIQRGRLRNRDVQEEHKKKKKKENATSFEKRINATCNQRWTNNDLVVVL